MPAADLPPEAEAFFADRVHARALFEQLRRVIDGFGPTQVKATKSRVAFVRRTRFCWVHEATHNGIHMAFLAPTDAPLAAARVRGGPVGKRWSCHVKVEDDIDDELTAWLRDAYEADAPRG